MAIDDDTLAEYGIDEDGSKRYKRGRGWPKLPGHDADLATIRAYLNQAAALPEGYSIDLAERHGQYGTDPMTVTIRTPGQARNFIVRFRNQRDASKPAGLRGAFVEATRGLSRMKYPKPAEASDFHVMLCALANVAEDSTAADETAEWLSAYLEGGDVLRGTLDSEGRYDTLTELQDRPKFDRVAAQAFLRADLPPGRRWAVVVDDEHEEQWIRVGEFTAYVRHVIGVGRLGQHTLDALMAEVGAERVCFEENRRRDGLRHMKASLYRVPPVHAIRRLYAKHKGEEMQRARYSVRESRGRVDIAHATTRRDRP